MNFLPAAIILSVVISADAWLYSQGHNGFFFDYKTVEEKRIREAQIQSLELDVKLKQAELKKLERGDR